jgi:hypothetical protein
MNIYKLTQSVNDDYDTYDSMVVAAESEQEAKNIHPSDYVTHVENGKWYGTYADKSDTYENEPCGWVCYDDIRKIDVELIGETSQPKGVILASFNA